MRSVNKTFLMGNVVRDPEVKSTSNGTSVATFSVATNERFKKSDGEWTERTEYHNVVAWDRLAEIVAQYLKKGSGVYIEGSLRTDKWTDKQDNIRYTTKITAKELVLLPSGHSDNGTEPAEVGANDNDSGSFFD